MIEPDEITGVDENTALRVIAYALSIAPCLDELPENTRSRKIAIAILIGIGREVASRGSRLVKSQRIGPGAAEYIDVTSCFSADDRGALRALCGGAAVAGGPIGRFPNGTVVSGLWPEEPSN